MHRQINQHKILLVRKGSSTHAMLLHVFFASCHVVVAVLAVAVAAVAVWAAA